MTEYRILRTVVLGASNGATGRTRHFVLDELLPPPASLQIAKYPNDDGYYLFYLDEGGNIMTDTWHESFEGAMRQAEFEFEVRPADWNLVGS